MLKPIIATILMCSSLSASAQTRAQKEEVINKVFTSDDRCLMLAELAGAVGRAQHAGDAEVKIINTGLVGSWSDRVYKNIVKFVYTMRLDGEQARQMVFLKCKMSEYNPSVGELVKK